MSEMRGRWLTQKGYIRVYMSDGRKPLEHTVIAERALGRRLRHGEVVHHIDGDKTNNVPSNLLICTSAYHNELHARLARSPNWPQFALGRAGYRTHGASKLKGVYANGSKWHAHASLNGKKHHIGTFASAVEAAIAYDNFVTVNHGPHWATNKSLGLI